MTIGIDCSDCGEEVVFWLDDGESVKPPTETCSCGATYRLFVKKVQSESQSNGGDE